MAGKRWTKEELKELKELVPLVDSIDKVLDAFPGRTKTSIQTKIERLGLKFKGQRREWTQREENLLKERYKDFECVQDVVDNLFPDRTYDAVARKMQRMGISVKLWTDDEKSFLTNNLNEMTNAELAPHLNKSEKAVGIMVHNLGLKRNHEYRSKTQQGINNHFFCHSHSDKTKQVLSLKWSERKSDPNWRHVWEGRNHTEESRKKMSDCHTEYYKVNPGKFKNKKHSDQTRQKMHKPHNMTEEGKETLRKSVMERRFKTHIDYTRRNGLIEHFDSSYELRIAIRCDELKYDWTRNHSKIRVKWIDENNSEHYYYPDFTIWFEGKEYIVEAKGEHLLDLNTTKRKLKAGKKLWGNKFLMVSESDISFFEHHNWFY